MEFKQLQSFETLVRYKSFTKAADSLKISQPTISTHIRLLEEELNTKLILRTTKSVEITPRGWELYEVAIKILELRDDLVNRWRGENKKLLHLGTSTIPSTYILPEVLPEFGRLYPETYFMIHQGNSKSVIDGISNGSYDIGLAGSISDDPEIVSIPFFQDQMIVITPVEEEYLKLDTTKPFDMELFRLSPVILREKGAGAQKTAEQYLKDNQIQEEDLNVIARVNDQETIKNFVAQGMGISIISEKAAQNYVKEKRILAFRLPKDYPAKTLYLILRNEDLAKTNIKEFVNHIRKTYQIPKNDGPVIEPISDPLSSDSHPC